MKKFLIVLVVLGVAATAYYYWQQNQPKPAVVQMQPPPPPPPPLMRQVIEAPPVESPLPELDQSDSIILDALAGLVSNKSLMKLFKVEQVIRNIVATIDNLPSQRIPVRTMPLESVPGKFEAAGAEGAWTIGPKNAARYSPYVSLVEVIDTTQLVDLYIRLYPLFQKAYEELGYPDKYFNDRVMTVIDHLLAAPDIKEPVKLIQPKIFYLYADPDLEARSIGQKTMMRIGSENEAKIKVRLKALKEELLLHMHEEEVTVPE